MTKIEKAVAKYRRTLDALERVLNSINDRYARAAHPAEAECSALRAEVERLRSECQEWNDELDTRAHARIAELVDVAETFERERDAANARIAELEDMLQDADCDLVRERDEAHARADAAEANHEVTIAQRDILRSALTQVERELAEANSRMDELAEECDAYQMQRDAANAARAAEQRAEREADTAEAFHKVAVQQRDAAWAECAALRAEVERLQSDREAELDARERYGFATAEQLATANALLEEYDAGPYPYTKAKVRAHLSTQTTKSRS